jgi:hypothetical protein
VARSRLFARLAAAAVLLVVVAIVVAVGMGVLAFGTGPARSGEIEVDGLSSRVTVAWPDEGPAIVEATDEAGLLAGLGYVHAADAAWAMTLWRQVALGNLSSWFPERGEMDRHARLLGIAALARQTWDTLPAEDRAALEAYARGVQAALDQPGVAQRDEFVLVDVRPEPWEPWHALAVERLVAWLGATPPAADTAFAAAARSDTALAAFARADSAFRAYLALGGFDHARAWAAPVGGEMSLVVEQPYGRSALPLYLDVVLRSRGRTVVAASIPGTIALPAGQDERQAWALFPTSPAFVREYSGRPPAPDYDRLVDRAGNETLLTIPRSEEGLFIAGTASPPPPAPAPPPPPADSTGAPTDSIAVAPPPPAQRTARNWLVAWPGFAPGTDVRAWRAVLAGSPPAGFRLLRGDGIRLDRAGGPAAIGAPPVRRDLPGGVFVAGNPASASAAERLAGLLENSAAGDTLLAYADDTYSTWAADRLGPLVTGLGDRTTLDPRLMDAYAFLRGWDARYSPDAIGASVFELLLASYRRTNRTLPAAPFDSADVPALRLALFEAVRELRSTHGVEPAGWRWEVVQTGSLVFPAWASGDTDAAADRYAQVPAERGGHPTTLRVGPSPLLGGAPAVWTLLVAGGQWDLPRIRAPRVQTVGFLARARSTAGELAPVAVDRRRAPDRTLALVPAPRR